ncbi:MAG TPA: hypothetical protein VG942_01415, partial [Hyphomonadaceae bacterium]|nr:hypothetical protein [Hyphomonadaceae bacterium]
AKVVAPTFRKSGGVFYVLPDTETLQEAIPAYGLNSVEAIAALEASDPVSPPGDDDVTDTGNATGGK